MFTYRRPPYQTQMRNEFQLPLNFIQPWKIFKAKSTVLRCWMLVVNSLDIAWSFKWAFNSLYDISQKWLIMTPSTLCQPTLALAFAFAFPPFSSICKHLPPFDCWNYWWLALMTSYGFWRVAILYGVLCHPVQGEVTRDQRGQGRPEEAPSYSTPSRPDPISHSNHEA